MSNKAAELLRLFFCFVFLLSCSWVFSQKIKWSSQIHDNKKTPYLSILGSNEDDDFFVIQSNMPLTDSRERSGFRNRAYFIQCYSSEMNLRWEKELNTSYVDGHISDVRMINDRVIVTSYITEKKSKYSFFFLQILGNDGKWIGQPIPIDSFPAETIDDDNKPGLISSRDQSLLGFTCRKIRKDRSQSFHLVVFDSSLAIKFRKEVEVPASAELFSPLSSILTDQGSFYVLGIQYSGEKKSRDASKNYYRLYGYNFPTQQIVDKAIKSENKFLSDVSMSADNVNKALVIAGFYSERSEYSVAGVFYYALTEDSLRETPTIRSPLSESYVQKFLGEKKESRELVNYSIDRLIVRKDGGVVMIAESNYESQRSYYDYFMQTFVTHTYHHFGNIMILSVNPDGNILWNNVISKDQNSVDDGGYLSSYSSAITGGRLVAIYNKYIDDDSSVLLTTVDKTGTQKTDVLVNEMERTYIIPKSARQVDEETILIPAYRNNKLFIMRLSF